MAATSGLVWMVLLALIVVAAVLLVLRVVRVQSGRRDRSRKARRLRSLQKEATHDLALRLTDHQDLDRWQEEFDTWCRRVSERLAREFSEEERRLFDAEHELPLGALAHSTQPRRDGMRLALTEKVRRLEIVIGRHLDAD